MSPKHMLRVYIQFLIHENLYFFFILSMFLPNVDFYFELQNKRKIKSEMAKNVSYWNKNYCVTNIVYHMYHCVNFVFQKVKIMCFYLYILTSTTKAKIFKRNQHSDWIHENEIPCTHSCAVKR